METTRPGVLFYLRVSKDEQARSGNSIPEQRRRLYQRFVGELGYELLDEYADEGRSASRDDEDRVQFWQMIERAKRDRRVKVIAVDDESRFYRDRYKAARIKAELAEYGVSVLTPRSAAFDPGSVPGLWLQSIEETQAHVETIVRRDQTIRGMAGNIRHRDPESGWAYKNGGRPPYGYRRVQRVIEQPGTARPYVVKAWWEIDETTAPVVRRILEWRKAGWSLKRIRDVLNAERTPAPRGGLWSLTTLQAMLRDDSVLQYAGWGIWYRHHRKRRTRRDPVWHPQDEWVMEPNAHPAIISQQDAEMILAVNRQRRQEWPGLRNNVQRSDYLLSGNGLDGEALFMCGRCGGRMIGGRPGRGRPKYLCQNYVHRGPAGCLRVPVDRETLENVILQTVVSRYCTEEHVRAAIRQVNETIRSQHQAADPQRERLRDIDRQLARIKRSILAGADPELWSQELCRLHEERRRLEAAVEQGGNRPRMAEIDESLSPQIAARLLEASRAAEPDERRQFIRAFVRRITLDPEEARLLVEFAATTEPLAMALRLARGGHIAGVVPPTRVGVGDAASDPPMSLSLAGRGGLVTR